VKPLQAGCANSGKCHVESCLGALLLMSPNDKRCVWLFLFFAPFSAFTLHFPIEPFTRKTFAQPFSIYKLYNLLALW
jgi:hypothetical protein